MIRMEESLFLVLAWRGLLSVHIVNSYRKQLTRVFSAIRSLP